MFFSIIVPTYNNSLLLKRTLNSIQNQSSKNFELIIIDNYSKDNTQEVVSKCLIESIIYKRINNQGVISKSRNLGIEISKGDWLIFLDSDDTVYQNKINFLTKHLNEDIDLACNNEKVIYSDSGTSQKSNYGPLTKNFYQDMLVNGNRFSTSASIIKKDFLIKKKIKFNENKDFVTAEDYDFFLNLVNAGAKVKFFDEILGDHHIYDGSMSSNYLLHKNSIKEVLKYHIFQIQTFSNDKKNLWKQVQWRFMLMDLIKNYKQQNYFRVLSGFVKILINSPFKFLNFIKTHILNKL